MITVDKNVFSPEERKLYESLIAKAAVTAPAGDLSPEPDGASSVQAPDSPSAPSGEANENELEKSVSSPQTSPAAPEITAALQRLDKLEKSIQMREFTDLAQKYAPLGENPEQLAKSLYDMHETSPDNYNAYLAILDKSLGLIEKSGLFAEIGKNAVGSATAGPADQIQQIANELMKADPALDPVQAIAKAWSDHPDLIRAYDQEYRL